VDVMAGRGATITVRLLSSGDDAASGEELTLSCALHTPLYILKQQLYGITQVRAAAPASTAAGPAFHRAH